MVLGRIFRYVARARAPDKEFSIINYSTIPELSTLIAAPDQVHAEGVSVTHDPSHHTLHVTIDDQHVTFALRSDHVLVFSENPFSPKEFREKLRQAAIRQRANTKKVPKRFQEHVSETAL